MQELQQSIESYLLERRGWVPAADLCERFGIRERQLRQLADRPGTGPAHATCKTCANRVRVEDSARAFWKCNLVVWSRGPATDLRLKDPACQFWKPSQTR